MAVEAELQRAMTAADAMHRYETVQRLLSAITMRASRERPNEALAILAWVSAVSERLQSTDPIEQLVGELLDDDAHAGDIMQEVSAVGCSRGTRGMTVELPPQPGARSRASQLQHGREGHREGNSQGFGEMAD